MSDDDMDNPRPSEEDQKKIDALQNIIDLETLKVHARVRLFLQKLNDLYDQEVLKGNEPNAISIASFYESLHEDATNVGVIHVKNGAFTNASKKWLLPPSLLVAARRKQMSVNRMKTVDVMKTYELESLYERYITYRLMLQPLVTLKSELVELIFPRSEKEKEYDARLNALAEADGFKPFTRERCHETTALIREL